MKRDKPLHINKILKIFNVRTEKETVNSALEIFVEDKEKIDAHKKLGGAGNIDKVFK